MKGRKVKPWKAHASLSSWFIKVLLHQVNKKRKQHSVMAVVVRVSTIHTKLNKFLSSF